MAKELNIQTLSLAGREQALSTISHNAFFMIVADALVSHRSLSVVRMGDGERQLFEMCQSTAPGAALRDCPWGETWMHEFGCYDIPMEELKRRLRAAAEDSHFFAPQIMGIQRPEFQVAWLFRARVRYVDNWFVREWSRQLQEQLFNYAGHVLFIHGKQEVRDAFAARLNSLGCEVDCLSMSTWQDADRIVEAANANSAQLVLFSGGPANKHIAPLIAENRKVVIDLGQAAAKEWV